LLQRKLWAWRLNLLALAVTSVPVKSNAATDSRAGDLDFAQTEYVLQSPAFSAQARNMALGFIGAAAQSADHLSPEQFLLVVFHIAAFADNGHDVVNDSEGAWWPTARLPIRMIWFPSGWVVARADSAHSDLVGARVIGIDGHPPESIFRRLRLYWGGPDTSRRWNLEFVVESAGLLHAAGLAQRADRLTFDLRLLDGRRANRILFFEPKTALPPGQYPSRVWSPALWPEEERKGWRAVNPPQSPLYLQDAERLFRVVPVPELDAIFLQMRTHFDGPNETVADFRRQADAAIAKIHPHNLIVDLRFDTGGNTELTREWQRTLITQVPGRIYVLVGNYTFSAGIVAAAAFKHDGAQRVRIVGDALGDRLRWWSEGQDVCLPHSHYCLHRTSGLWDLLRNCGSHASCYGDKYDAQVDDLAPDLEAPLTADAWLAGRDPAMEAIQSDLQSR
jgi:hypothetical protein